MTEIPEHLLKRAQAARAKAEGAPPPADSPSAATPATVAAATPAAAAVPRPAKNAGPAPKPVKIDPAYVKAAKHRKRMPFWAMSALSIMPVWGFMYVRGMQPDVKAESGPLVEGRELYNGRGACSSCHLANGSGSEGGGAGRPLWNGEILDTFPAIEDQLNFVYLGTAGYNGEAYGNPDREGGPHIAGSFGSPMPAQKGQLTDAEILAVVCHVRYPIGGAEDSVDAGDERWNNEFETWCAPEAPMWLELEEGKTFAEIAGVGVAARPGADEEHALELLDEKVRETAGG